MTGDSGKKDNKPPSTGRVWERSKGDTTCGPPPGILLSGIHLGWTRRAPPGRTLSQTTRKLWWRCTTDFSKSYNTVCPRPESCDTLRGALTSVTPNLCCDETKTEEHTLAWQHHKTRDCKPCDRAVLLGSLTLLLSTLVPFPSKITCFVSTCVSLDNCWTSVRQEPNFGPWKGFPFCNKLTAQFRALEEVPLPATIRWSHTHWTN